MSPLRPVFRLHVFAEPATMSVLFQHSPSVRRALFVDGVPEEFIGRRYAVVSDVTLLETRKNEFILQFGTSGLSNPVGVDLATGNVVKVMNVRDSSSVFVNTSIEQFTKTVEEILHRFPYYSEGEIGEKAQAVGEELLEIVRMIDAEAALPDRYWSIFVNDVEIGDLSTEAILEID